MVGHSIAGYSETDYGPQQFVLVGTPKADIATMAGKTRVASVSTWLQIGELYKDFGWHALGVVESSGPMTGSRTAAHSARAVTVAVKGQLTMVNYWAGLNCVAVHYLWFAVGDQGIEPFVSASRCVPKNALRCIRVGRVAMSGSSVSTPQHRQTALHLVRSASADRIGSAMHAVGQILVHLDVREYNFDKRAAITELEPRERAGQTELPGPTSKRAKLLDRTDTETTDGKRKGVAFDQMSGEDLEALLGWSNPPVAADNPGTTQRGSSASVESVAGGQADPTTDRNV